MNVDSVLHNDRVRVGRWHPATITYFLVFTLIGMMTAMLGPALPSLAASCRVALGDLSILFTARSLGYLLGALPVGHWYDRGAGHGLMGGMLLLTALLTALAPVSTQVWLLFLVVFLVGLAESMVDIGGNTFLIWNYREKVAPFMNGLHFFFGVGGFFAPLLLAKVLELKGEVAWGFWLLAMVMVLPALKLLSMPAPLPPKKHHREAVEKAAVQWRLLIPVLLFMFSYIGVEIGFGGWVYSYALALGLTGVTGAAFVTSLFWGAFTLARLLSIPVSLRYSPLAIMISGIVICLASLVLLVCWQHSLTVLYISSAGVGFSLAAIFPTTLAFCEQKIGVTGKITSLFFVFAGLGMMTFPWLFGKLLAYYGGLAMVVGMIVVISAALAFLLLLVVLCGGIRGAASR